MVFPLFWFGVEERPCSNFLASNMIDHSLYTRYWLICIWLLGQPVGRLASKRLLLRGRRQLAIAAVSGHEEKEGQEHKAGGNHPCEEVSILNRYLAGRCEYKVR